MATLDKSFFISFYEVDTLNELLESENFDDFEFTEKIERGDILDITCGTYNGALNIFTPYKMNNLTKSITISNIVREIDFDNYFEEERTHYELIEDFVSMYKVYIVKDTNRFYWFRD